MSRLNELLQQAGNIGRNEDGSAGAGLHHRHAGLQRAALGGKGKHRLGQAVLGGTRRAAEIEIREDAGTQPVLRGIAVQPHDGAAVDVLIIAVQDGHGGALHSHSQGANP